MKTNPGNLISINNVYSCASVQEINRKLSRKLELYTAVIVDSTCANSELYSCSVSRSCLFSISKSWACISFWWCITPCLRTGMGSGGERGGKRGGREG